MACRCLAALLALGLTTASLGEQHLSPPTDADFRAAYCIPLLDEEIDFIRQAARKLKSDTVNSHQADSHEFRLLRQQHLAQWLASVVELEKTRERLSAYFIPRRASLDARTRSEANLAAHLDWGDFVMQFGRCEEEGPFNPGGLLQVHMKSCASAPLIARVQSCRNPTWLPFSAPNVQQHVSRLPTPRT